MSKSIGIDLGTTNSSAAIKKVHTEVLKNAEGEPITPSCVTLRQGRLPFSTAEFVIGKDALDWRKQDPANTIVAVKRLMGRNFQDPEIQTIIKERRVHYRIAPHSQGTENSLIVVLNGKEFTPEEISAEILKKLRRDAEKTLGDAVEYAVITVPAYFNDKQKHATRAAALLAGLKVRRLLPEPTAAAISFGVDQVKGDEAKTVLIFDFGGGTLDLSLLTISAGQFIEQGKGGDMWLGGEDIDRLLEDFVLSQTAQACKLDMTRLIDSQNVKTKCRFWGELKAAVEQAKIRLSSETRTSVEIMGLLRDAEGEIVDVNVEITRARFEELIAPLVAAAVGHVRKLLEDTRFTPDLVDSILLVGGSSQTPSLEQALKRAFGERKVLLHERPLLAVAEGAAILSHRLSDVYECPGCGVAVGQQEKACPGCGFDLERNTIGHGILDIVHTTAHDYAIRLEDGILHPLIEKNTPLPCEKKEIFQLVHPEQKLVHMKFSNRVHEQEACIGDLWLGFDAQNDADNEPQGPLHVEIAIKIDENNLIEVTAALKERPDVRLTKTLSRGKADEKLFLSLAETIEEANQRKYNSFVGLDLTQRALSIVEDIHDVIDPDTEAVSQAVYERAAMKIAKARRMAEEGKTSKPTIWYAQSALSQFALAIKPAVQAEIIARIKTLEKMDEQGTYEANVAALDALQDAIDQLDPIVGALMEIQKAGENCAETAPARAPVFSSGLKNILAAISARNMGKASLLLE